LVAARACWCGDRGIHVSPPRLLAVDERSVSLLGQGILIRLRYS
jgi:hypothetical protein